MRCLVVGGGKRTLDVFIFAKKARNERCTSPWQTSWAFLAKKNIQFSLLLPPTKHHMP
jgi:hypothetical protein